MNAASGRVQEFCQFLAMIGVAIDGLGTSRLCVTGGGKLGAAVPFRRGLPRDRDVPRARRDHRRRHHGAQFVARAFPADRPHLREVRRDRHAPRRLVARGTRRPAARAASVASNILTKVEAAPWPYLPVDLLPIFIALGVRAEGSAMFWNKVYDGALGWSGELSKFGAHVLLSDPHRLITFGGLTLTPARVESPYIIRVAIALLMVAASIEGRSEIMNALPIRRAHPHFVENLRSVGANVEWTSSE
jgi:UDP-N-acetylglucosamine 1-carboxyvinyltransferase